MKRGPTTYYDLLAAYAEVLWRQKQRNRGDGGLFPTKLPPVTTGGRT